MLRERPLSCNACPKKTRRPYFYVSEKWLNIRTITSNMFNLFFHGGNYQSSCSPKHGANYLVKRNWTNPPIFNGRIFHSKGQHKDHMLPVTSITDGHLLKICPAKSCDVKQTVPAHPLDPFFLRRELCYY